MVNSMINSGVVNETGWTVYLLQVHLQAHKMASQCPSTGQGDPSKQDTLGRDGPAKQARTKNRTLLKLNSQMLKNILERHQMRTECELSSSNTDWFIY